MVSYSSQKIRQSRPHALRKHSGNGLHKRKKTGFASIEEAVNEVRSGKMVIVVDDPDRENEGDLVCAAEKVTPELISFMARYGRGLICLPIVGSRLDELGIEQMVANPREARDASFTVSIDAKHNTTTGISAHDRAATIKAVLAPRTKPNDLSKPGHVFPLRYLDLLLLRLPASGRIGNHCYLWLRKPAPTGSSSS